MSSGSEAVAYIQANSCGRLHDAIEPAISPLDRGYLYGDAVYEVWRTVGGHVFSFEEHWERLERSAGATGLALQLDPATCIGEIGRTIAAYRLKTGWRGDCYIRLQISRGVGQLRLDPFLSTTARWTFLVKMLDVPIDPTAASALTLSVSRNFRRNARTSVDPASKTGNYMNNLLCLSEARSRGFDDSVILNQAGEVAEASTANLFFVSGRRVYTPPLSSGILGGVTRQIILFRLPRAGGISLFERPVYESDLGDFDECFLASTTRDIVPVCGIDRHQYACGASSVTMELKAAFAVYMDANPGIGILD